MNTASTSRWGMSNYWLVRPPVERNQLIKTTKVSFCENAPSCTESSVSFEQSIPLTFAALVWFFSWMREATKRGNEDRCWKDVGMALIAPATCLIALAQ